MRNHLLRMLCMVVFVALSIVSIGCSPQLGEGSADADSDVGVAAEALTQTELSCAAMSLLTPGLNASERVQFTRGCVTYRTETFDGNGRTCESCHMLNLGNGNPDDNNFDLSIEDVETAWAEDPTGPLFRSIDADDGGSDFTTLRTLADVRVSLPLHPNVSVVPDGSPLVSADGRTVTVWRSTPTSENIVLDANVMWDGRFGDDLELQVREAVLAHFEPGRAPTVEEAMVVYRFLGEVTADGLNALGVDGEGFRLSDQRTTDIINYFEYAFRHRPVLNP